MATDVRPTELLDARDLPIEEIAKLPTIDLSRILGEQPSVPVASFGSSI